MTTQRPDLGHPIDAAGKYRLGALLGQGGMAEVYLGYVTGAEGFSRRVAIKRVLASFSADPHFARLFITEARLASMLSSPNVVSVLDFNRDDEGRLYQVIEYVDGVDLEKLATPGSGAPTLPPALVSYIMASVLMGLRHAHTATNPETGAPLGIVHRDCTPSNVLVGWDGTVKLSDFGVAKAKQATFATHGSVKGKPMYMAPEQLDASPDMDARVDLFALGCMLWELLTGHRPFAPRGDETGVSAVLANIVLYGRGDLRIDTAHAVSGGTAPVALSNLAVRLLAPHPADRPASANDALAELRACGPVATGDDLALLLAERFPERAPRATSEMVARPAPHSLPTNVERAVAANRGMVVETLGRTPPPLGDLSEAAHHLAAPRRRRLGLVLVAAVAMLTAAVIAIIATRDGNTAASHTAGGFRVDDAQAASRLPLDAGPANVEPADAAIEIMPLSDASTDTMPLVDAVASEARTADARTRRIEPRPARGPDAGTDRRHLVDEPLTGGPP